MSIREHGRVDLPYMAELRGSPGDYERITTELQGVIFKDPSADADEPEMCIRDRCYLMPDETALRELSEGVIEKLKLLTDAEFAELEFPPELTFAACGRRT